MIHKLDKQKKIANLLPKRAAGKYYHTICSLTDLIGDISGIIDTNELDIDVILDEFDEIEFLQRGAGVRIEEALALYLLVRSLRPDTLLETGTYKGVSTTYISAAMNRNGKGTIVTVDTNSNAGEDIPEHLCDRISFYRGISSIASYNDLRQNEAPFDIFFHDSLHSYENVICELFLFAQLLTDNGIIICHDAKMDHVKKYGVGQACREFAQATQAQLCILDTTTGMAVIKIPKKIERIPKEIERKIRWLKVVPRNYAWAWTIRSRLSQLGIKY